MSDTMRAVTYHRYGPPEVVGIGEVPRPAPGEGEILVRVHASVVTPTDCAARAGSPFLIRFITGLRRPRSPILGSEVAGVVEAVGPGVTRFRPGDRAMGGTGATFGAHAEYAAIDADGAVTVLPAGASFAEAVSLAEGPMTAMSFLRDHALTQPGHDVLINGASGSVGSAAVQLARHLGASVTGVCSGANVDLVRSLGADHVIDYTREDFTAARDAYDVIFDAVGTSSFRRCQGALRDGGVYLDTAPSLNTVLWMLWTSRLGRKRAVFAATGLRKDTEKLPDLVLFSRLFEAGELRPVIDRTYPMADAVEAYRYVESRRKRGNVILEIGSGSSPA